MEFLYVALGIFLGAILFTLFHSPKIHSAETRDHEDLALANQRIGELENRVFDYVKQLHDLQHLKEALEKDFDTLRHQKISADVKMGQKSEQLAGLMQDFPVPLHTLKFLGAPIDYVSIDLEKSLITFIEVKTGVSRLSETQKKIRKIIKDKNVEFREYRM